MFVVSVHRLLRSSTDFFMRWRYLSSCSSAVGRRFLNSRTARSFAFPPAERIRSCWRFTFSFCVDSACCHFSSFAGNARLSKISRKPTLSKGGNVSQSSRNEPLLRKEPFRVKTPGLGGYDGRRLGVIGSRWPSSVSELIGPNDGDASAFSSGASRVEVSCFGMGMGSDILCNPTCDGRVRCTLRSRLTTLSME